MFKNLTIGLLVIAGCAISLESTQAFGGRRRAAQNYVSPAPAMQTAVTPGVAVAVPGSVTVATPQYQAPRYQSPPANYFYPSSRQPQDASYAYPKTDMRRYNFQYNHN